MRILRYIFMLVATVVGTSHVWAQSISESVTVEGKYTPEIIPADPLALFPSMIALVAPESPMAYDRKGVPSNFAPDALNLPVTGWRAKKYFDSSRGYLDFRIGSWLNSSLSAGFNAISNQDTRLNVYLQHNSTSLWQPWKEDAEKALQAADKRFRYDETIGADLTHKILGIGNLKADFKYHLGYFNYYGTRQGGKSGHPVAAPTQTLNDVYACVGWTGVEMDKLTYAADVDVRHFAYRAMYMPLLTDQYPRQYAKTKGERETALNVEADVKYRLSNEPASGSSLVAALRYSGVINAIGNNVNRVELLPAYTLTESAYTLRVGANLAVVGNGATTRFRIAPDIRFSARKGIMAFLASIGGGTHLRTMAWMHSVDYYSNPGYGCYQAAYTPIDVKLAFQLNPGGKWTFGVEGEWLTTSDESFGGLYQALLNCNLADYGSYPESGRIRGFSIAANAGYEFCRFFALKGNVAFQPQKGKSGFMNGFDRPVFTADISAESKPIDKLFLHLDYRLRAKRELLPGNMSRLDLAADYSITDKISVGVGLYNLLNRHEEFLPGLPLEGFNAAGGVGIVF